MIVIVDASLEVDVYQHNREVVASVDDVQFIAVIDRNISKVAKEAIIVIDLAVGAANGFVDAPTVELDYTGLDG